MNDFEKTRNETRFLLRPETGAISGFLQGVTLPFRGMVFILKRPKLWPAVIIPVMINAAIFIVALIWGYSAFNEFLRSLYENWEELAWYWKSLAVLGRVLYWLLGLVLTYYVFTPVALIIASPFNDYLAERAERACGLFQEDELPIWKMIFRELLFAARGETKRIVFFGLVFLALLPVNLVPVIGTLLYVALSFLWAIFGFSFEFVSFATDRRHYGLKRKLALLKKRPAITFGFGLTTLAALLIPFLNILAVSVSAVSGSLFFCMMADEKRKTPPEKTEAASVENE